MGLWSSRAAPLLGLRVVEPVAPRIERLVWGVGALLHALSDALAARFSACTVRGELSGFTRAASGHCYFTLKDGEGGGASVRCAMFRRAAGLLDFRPADGQLVEVRGRVAIYEPRGELQFVAESMQLAGDGALFEQFLRLKARLEAEGWFDPARKRPLPAFVRRLGVVTSLGAAALHDVLTCLARRAPHVQVVVYPGLVQGAEAPAALVDAIAAAGKRQEVDVLLICRGGGSLQDLWAFNDERVVRAVARCPVPVISGVGHETDVTLCDFAADLRAPTPTAAAELATRTRQAHLDRLDALRERLGRRLRHALDLQAQRLDRATLRLVRPADATRHQALRLDALAQRLAASVPRATERQAMRLHELARRLGRPARHQVDARAHRLLALEARLGGLSPQRVLSRGYAWLADAQGLPVTSVGRLTAGQGVRAVLADGQAQAVITQVEPDKAPAAPRKKRTAPLA